MNWITLDQRKPALTPVENSGKPNGAGVAFPDFRSLQKFHCFLIDKAA